MVSKASDILKRIQTDPLFFFEEFLGEKSPERYGLYDKQKEILKAVASSRRVAVCGANSTGKDFIAGRLPLWWLSAHRPSKCIIIGPTYRQINSIVWKETRMGFANTKYPLPGHILETPRWDISDDCFALGFSTDQPIAYQGFHSPHLLILISEAHGVDQDNIEAIKRLNPEKLLLTGNPLSSAGEFYNAFHINTDLYTTIQISAFDTPNIKEKRMVIPGMITLEDIAEREREWGKDSPLYIASILGQFPSSLEDTLISRLWVDNSLKLDLKPDKPKVLGCDIARFGTDKSIVFKREGGVTDILWRGVGKDTMEVTGMIMGFKKALPDFNVIVDDVGVGGGVTDRLRELGISVIPFQGGGVAFQKDRFANAVSEAWYLMGEGLKEGKLKIPNDAALISQLCSRKYKIQSDRTIILESKDALKSRGGKSPDEADALAMTFSPWATGGGFKLWI